MRRFIEWFKGLFKRSERTVQDKLLRDMSKGTSVVEVRDLKAALVNEFEIKRSKEATIKELEDEVRKLQDKEKELALANLTISEYQERIDTKDSEIRQLNWRVETKEKKIAEEQEKTNDKIIELEKVKEELERERRIIKNYSRAYERDLAEKVTEKTKADRKLIYEELKNKIRNHKGALAKAAAVNYISDVTGIVDIDQEVRNEDTNSIR